MVGGAVRDELLGVKSKDIDYTVVLENEPIMVNSIEPFDYMVSYLRKMGFKIFLETPEYLTVRAQFPKGYQPKGSGDDAAGYCGFCNQEGHSAKICTALENRYDGLTADFVLARKESEYTDGRRPDKVIPGTLEDDLARRDFTMNAIAKDPDTGEYIDPFGGIKDIENKVIRAVGQPMQRLREDALRAIRALRFYVTKDFSIDRQLLNSMRSHSVLDSIQYNISDERIQQELSKMFRFDTTKTLFALQEVPELTRAMFAGNVSLDATLKTKGRG